jgi:hypothetical protein
MSERIYVGNGREVNGCPLINFSLKKEKIMEHFNEKGYLNLTIGKNKNGIDKYKNTHAVWINDWKPEQKAVERVGGGKLTIPEIQDDQDDLPF